MKNASICLFVTLALEGYPAWAQEPQEPAQPSIATLTQQAAPSQISPIMQAPLEKSRAAIAECRERRLRNELKSYKESAQCSNPKIFAAWQEANYPHMDLITAWLNAREAASEKVDQHIITPDEFERQMQAITVRLTAEERRRRAGFVNSPDTDLALQLPAATKVLGVATPAGQEKLASQKSITARARAATISPDTAGPQTVGSLSTVTTLDSRASKTMAMGGPFVPVNAKGATPGEGSSGLYAQVAAQRSEAEARLAFRALQGQYPNLLGGRDAVIRVADDGNRGTFYRVEIGPLSASQAGELCGNLKAAGAQCVPRYE